MLSHIVRGFRFGSVLSLILLAAGWAAPAMAQVKLEHKFVEGRKTVTHTTLKTKQTLTLMGMGLETESDRFIISTSQAGKRNADGNLPIEQKVDKLTVNVKLPGGLSLTFDSDDPNKAAENPALEPFLKGLRVSVKAKPIFIRDMSGKVITVEGLDKVAEDLPEELRGDVNPEQAKKTANQELGNLPEKPVKVGDTWTKTSDLPLGGGQIMTVTTEYTYMGEVKEGGKSLEKIEAKATAVVLSVTADAKAMKVDKSDLKPTESFETILFDRDAGQAQSTKGKVRIQGDIDLKLTINGMEIAFPGSKLDLTIEVETVRQP